MLFMQIHSTYLCGPHVALGLQLMRKYSKGLYRDDYKTDCSWNFLSMCFCDSKPEEASAAIGMLYQKDPSNFYFEYSFLRQDLPKSQISRQSFSGFLFTV